MSIRQQKRSSTVQPRPTKASLMRQQSQQASSSSPSPNPISPPSNALRVQSATTTRKSSTTSRAQASEGVRAFMASKRAAAAAAAHQKKEVFTERTADPRNRVMTGAGRYTFSADDTLDEDVKKPNLKLQTVIAQAKSTGRLNISNRELRTIPDEVWTMYHVDPNKVVVDFNSSGDAWYDTTELTKFMATDNIISELDERIGHEFGALTLIDIRNNQLHTLPSSLSQLQQLTALYLSHNRFETIPESVFDLPKLRDLDLSHNRVQTIPPEIRRLSLLEILNLEDNNLRQVPDEIGQLTKLRKLYLSHNHVIELPTVEALNGWQKLQELHLSKNQMRTLFRSSTSTVVTLPLLVRLDVRQNSMSTLVDGKDKCPVALPELKELLMAYNQLSEQTNFDVLKSAPSIQTLDISSNLFADIPETVLELHELVRLDVSSNHLRTLRPDIAKLEHLAVINWEGNPLRSIPRNMTMVELIQSLREKLVLEVEGKEKKADEKREIGGLVTTQESPSSLEKEGCIPAEVPEPARATGTLDLSGQKLTEIEQDSLIQSNKLPATLQLHHNLLSEIPNTLNVFAATLVHLNLEHNRLVSVSLTSDTLVFSSLKTLSLANNRISSIMATPEATLSFPRLVELNINNNQLRNLPEELKTYLPSLRTLRANSNHIEKISAKTLENLAVIDLAFNDIAYLPPEIGRITTISEFMVYGNIFRIPRQSVLDQGTHAILEFLRRRLGD
ncbi:hypothetical protein BX666DRAFT_1980456 [Dichotomocladium elegans]|nr:hypothetical protein BX666DRAFT_1980456 [Dichotomocladium elegans]